MIKSKQRNKKKHTATPIAMCQVGVTVEVNTNKFLHIHSSMSEQKFQQQCEAMNMKFSS